MFKFKRFFYPMGQGAFYSEKHSGFNMVYDCGNWRKTKASEKVVSQSFRRDDVIDILFISHLDWDHISQLKKLKDTVKKIDCVVMPLLHEDEKILIKNIHRALEHTILSLITEPSVFFGDQTKILFVRPVSNAGLDGERNDAPIDLAQITSGEIDSGTRLRISANGYDWLFIPFNHESEPRADEFESALNASGFDVAELKSNSEYTLTKVIDKAEKDKLKKAYESVSGNINKNALVLYSGMQSNQQNPYDFSHFRLGQDITCYLKAINYDKSACVYTGDVDLNEFDIKLAFQNFWQNVGTLQIPHHGSIKDFNASVLTGKEEMMCPISFGTDNTYGHPSLDVLGDIISNNAFSIPVTETLDSSLIQCFEWE